MSKDKQHSRPSLEPKHTRTSEKKRQGDLDEGVRITFEGETYQVTIGDLTPQLVRELRRVSGYSFNSLADTMSRDPDVDVLSTFVWLARRVKGEDIDHDTVSIGYAALYADDFDLALASGREVDDSPET